MYLYHLLLMPKISIITTTYKHSDFITHTIDSVLAQTYTDRELLIWDDSPDDATRDIISSYTSRYPDKIKARHHIPNKWIVDNMNFLISQSSYESEYLSFLEWDDMYTPDNLQQKIHIFEHYPEVKLVYSDLSFIDKNNNTILRSFFDYRNIRFYQNEIISIDDFVSAKAWPIASRSTGMIKKDILEIISISSLQPDNKTYSVSDYDLYFQIATKYPVYGIETPLTQYRRHSNNLSWTSWWTSWDLEILINYYHKIWKINLRIYKIKLSWIYIVYCIFTLEICDYNSARRYIRQSISYNKFSFLFWKIWCISLLCIPSKISKLLLTKFIKRW